MAAKKKRGRKSRAHKIGEAFGKVGLERRYKALKSEYHAAGLHLFKARHGGLTPKQWSAKHTKKRRAKHGSKR